MRHCAVGLCRVSTAEQAAEGRAGLIRQRDQIEVAGRRYGLHIVKIVEITDVSGTQVAESTEFQAVLRELERADIDGLVVADQDRIVRPDDFVSFSIFQAFYRTGKLIWTPSAEIDVRTDPGFMQVVMQGLMAGLDRRRILRNTQAGKEANRRRGRCANALITLPQGVTFDFKAGRWSWQEPAATRIKTAFQMILSGNHSILSVARALGYRCERTLYNQLRNPIWTGIRAYTHKRGEKYGSTNGKQCDRKKVLRPEPLEVVIAVEPLVSKADFDRVQEILAEKRTRWATTRATESRFEASGVLYCACGEPMYSKGDQRPGKSDFYYCRSQHPRGRGCGAGKHRRDQMDYTLTILVRDILTQPHILKRLLDTPENKPDARSLEQEIQRAEAELARLQTEKSNLLRQAIKGIFDDAEVERERRRIDSESRHWTAQRDRLRRQLSAASVESIKAVATALASVFAEFEFLSLSDRKRLLRAYVSRIELSAKGVTRVSVRLPVSVATDCNRTGRGS